MMFSKERQQKLSWDNSELKYKTCTVTKYYILGKCYWTKFENKLFEKNSGEQYKKNVK